MKRSLVALLTLCLAFVAADALAAVRVGEGSPRVTRGDEGVWSAEPSELGPETLNPRGDLFGDGIPHMAQAPDGSWWAVWSLAEGRQRDVAVSRFDGVAWSPPEMIVAGNGRIDLDPRIGFLRNGSAVVVWWQKGTRADRTPRVVASYQTRGRWSGARPLSPEGVAAWRPGIRLDGNVLTVAYDTKAGITIGLFEFGLKPDGGTEGPTPIPDRVKRPGNPGDDPGDDGHVPANPA